jgi:hypothetical protein
VNLKMFKGLAARLVERTVGVDKVRGELDDVAAFLKAEGITGEEFVEQVEAASKALACEAIAKGPLKDVAAKLSGLFDDAALVRGTGELTPEMLGVPGH